MNKSPYVKYILSAIYVSLIDADKVHNEVKDLILKYFKYFQIYKVNY